MIFIHKAILKRNGKIVLNNHKNYDKILFYLIPKFIWFNTQKKNLNFKKCVNIRDSNKKWFRRFHCFGKSMQMKFAIQANQLI